MAQENQLVGGSLHALGSITQLFYNTIFIHLVASAPCPYPIQMKRDQFDLIEKQEHIERAARALKSMSHPLRLKILCVLGPSEMSVQGIVDAVGTSQSNISQHLAILRDKGVLRARKEANRVFYRVGDERTLQLIGMMREVFCGVTRD